MPQPGMILENREVITARYGTHPSLTPIVKEVFNYNQTDKQAEAVDVAINTPDIALIQGPPGTGKTKVISAIVKRLQEISDKNQAPAGELLVCSEQHDAVENVASGSDVLAKFWCFLFATRGWVCPCIILSFGVPLFYISYFSPIS